ncbi:5',5'''-P-1,P-4-tetraphosphate phosphorylase, putative [Talaromyces stipitatus ATCC 10500]|uniref:5',5'''-P-1,P-4-tetraphosphate phosphorylase, putative n=1 Tax=Talaromyces stipitatus (strain ATCC 10500 / CBS 375.48 / QM 6759 / NRRL 1006) TaxID=441959 RepID=B8M536_TALSN|nr:5',5'''-P-1,P-4-tetraphosphate phosphorylase, putative [Talaromyces stipitatus ATCC 10500]EED19642.1 5',5'''-P-1,P-4-tetraphosphate phosphorylase, putative [Talaromyces stipitatus ATCC 10500]
MAAQPHAASPDIEDTKLPSDLEERTNIQFDEMVRKGRIFYDHQTEPGEVCVDDGFVIEYRIVPILKGKPILAPDDPGRSNTPTPESTRASTPVVASASSISTPALSPSPKPAVKGPFVNPKPDEVVYENVGSKHRLMLNKFCLYRPMLVLPTKEFALQSDDLDASDVTAAWAILHSYHTFEPLVIYNRGVNGGSSQGHKHLQLFPVPPLAPFHGKAENLWPAKATSSAEVSDRIPHVPFKHYVLRIPPQTHVRTVVDMYFRLLELTRKAHVEAGHNADSDYNVTMTRDWIALIPRTTAGPSDGPFGTSTVGMLGMPAIRDERDREKWRSLGDSKFLAKLGIPQSQ